MPTIKIYYGNMPFWRAEVSRLALHLGKVMFILLSLIVITVKSILTKSYKLSNHVNLYHDYSGSL